MIAGLVTLMLLILTIGLVAYFANKNIQKEYQYILETDEHARYLLKNIQYRATGISNDQRAYLLTGDTEFERGIQEKHQEIVKDLKEVKSSMTSNDVQHAIVIFDQELQAYITIGSEIRNTYHTNKEQALKQHLTDERDLRKGKLDPALNHLIKLADQDAIHHMEMIKKHHTQSNVVVVVLLVVAMVIGILIFIVLYKSLQPLQQLQHSVHMVANGDLTKNISIQTTDEIGVLTVSVNQMIETLRSTIAIIADSTHHMASSAEQLAASSNESTKATEQFSYLAQDFSSSTEDQLEKFIVMSEGIHELSDDIKRVHHNGIAMKALSDTAKHASNEGHQGMMIIHSEMGMIAESVESISKIIHRLEEKSSAIGHIVSLISNIAEQTNLLALNAAIESARAGEHGKGFAIVANEVRKLAEESKNSANRVREVLVEIQQETSVAARSMQDGLQKVTLGMDSTNEVAKTFQTIDVSIAQLTEKVIEIAYYLDNMSTFSNEVVHVVQEVKTLAEHNTSTAYESLATTQEQLATSEEISAASDTLAKLADEQRALITKFQL